MGLDRAVVKGLGLSGLRASVNTDPEKELRHLNVLGQQNRIFSHLGEKRRISYG